MPVNNHEQTVNNSLFVRQAVEAAIRISLITIVAFWCFDIVKPFIIAIIWGVIIAVAIYPHYLWLLKVLGGRQTLAACLYTLFILILLIIPTLLLAGTLIVSIENLAKDLGSGIITIPPPMDSVGSWPVVGEPLLKFWHLASQNLEAALRQIAPHLIVVGSWLLSTAKGTGLGLLQFIAAIIISGFLLAGAKSGQYFTQLVAQRFFGDRGTELTELAQATVHSVALGILGVAAIQSLLAGLGFIVAGVPGAGLWALLCLLFSVLQIGILLIIIPIVVYMFYYTDTFTAVAFLTWITPISFIDTFLKPILLSRGVKTPMMIIFMGAIGGFLTSGIVGLFIGAVILSLSYELLLNWLKEDNQENNT